jgi:predicted CopG family antitoxin
MEVRKEKESKTIRISREHYDKIVELGDMTKSFDDVLGDIMKQANVRKDSAASAEK